MTFLSRNQRGQVLLIAVLVMVVALTVGLAVATRTISNLRTSTEEESSQRAFSAAEAGIEQALRVSESTTIASSFGNNTSFSATSEQINGTQIILNNGEIIQKDDGVDVWLSEYGTYGSQWSGDITLYWSTTQTDCDVNPAINTQAAVEIVLLHGPSSAPQATHHVFDPCDARNDANGFLDPLLGSGTVGGQLFYHHASFTVTQGLYVRIIPLYASTKMAVVGSLALPSQGWRLTSTGKADCVTGNASGCTVHKIISYKPYPKIPVEFFPYLLFSP